MRTADNDNLTPPEGKVSSENATHEAGMSSAMHDIRMLTKSYTAHRDQQRELPAQFAPQTAVDPRVLLIPTAEVRTDRFKIAMLSLMVIMGLSTSAIAVRLAMQSTPVEKSQNYKGIESGQESPVLLPPAPALVDAIKDEGRIESETPGYQVPESPESSRVNPEEHKLVVPPLPKTTKRKTPARRIRSSRASVETKAAETCDEVACFLGEGGACCGQESSDRAEPDAEEERAARPYRLSRKQVMQPMKSVEGRVRSCADDFGFEGVATVALIISPEGSVQEFALDAGTSSFQSCVEAKVSSLHFPKLSQSFSTKYPYILR